MSNSTTLLDQISSSQASKEVTANAIDDAESPAALFGRRASTTTALTWGYYGGVITVDGVLTAIANGTVALSASLTNFVEADRAGTVTKNTTAFTAGRTPLYSIVAGASTITSYTDYRLTTNKTIGKLSKSIAGSSNVTLTAAEASNDILEFTGAITGNISVFVPLSADQWTVFNGTTGAFTVTIIGATGTGIVIATAKRAIVYADGTNVVRVTADV